jgi:hypothetical protein
MHGDYRSRFCEHCQLNVQNLSAMSRRHAARLMKRSRTEHVCVTYTRRADGVMVTRADLVRERLITSFRRLFSWLLAASIPLVVSACQTQSQLTGRVLPQSPSPQPQKKTAATEERVIVTGGI